ncbi:GntR family transcriptional regulator [Paenibacillus ehimensis]|uniref:GntR family transcriptional regulator n=1 Tax=Paenibacillus ehimensis TaxID=79264 RepID=UPI003D26B11E
MGTPIYEKIIRHLLKKIELGQLKPKERVPSEKELADQFGVSRITSKKALEKLAQYGVVTRIRGKGSYVSEHFDGARIPEFGHCADTEDSFRPGSPPGGATEKVTIGIIASYFSASFGLNILRTVEKTLSARNYHLIVKCTYGKKELEEQFIRSLLDYGVDGLIVSPVNGEHYNEELLKLVYRKFPLVLIDKYLPGIPACSVYTDHKEAAGALTDYLLDQGHEQVVFVSAPADNTSSIEERIQGFTGAFLKRRKAIGVNAIFTDMPVLNTSVHEAGDPLEWDTGPLQAFLEQNRSITAIFACEYDNAILLSHALRQLDSYRDCEIVCFDMIYSRPGDYPFTHILQDEREIGRKAAELLLAQLERREVPLLNPVGFKLKIRPSDVPEEKKY